MTLWAQALIRPAPFPHKLWVYSNNLYPELIVKPQQQIYLELNEFN